MTLARARNYLQEPFQSDRAPAPVATGALRLALRKGAWVTTEWRLTQSQTYWTRDEAIRSLDDEDAEWEAVVARNQAGVQRLVEEIDAELAAGRTFALEDVIEERIAELI